MAWWIYKCNSTNQPYQVQWGDWEDCWDRARADDGLASWGSKELIPQLADLSPGDMVIACQTDRNELVGVLKVDGFRGEFLFLEPIEEIGKPGRRTKVKPLKKANRKIAAISALKPGSMRTLHRLGPAEAQTLLRAARKAK